MIQKKAEKKIEKEEVQEKLLQFQMKKDLI